LAIDAPNVVWSTDITYIRLPGGFIYLVAVIDWFSRYVLSWEVSNTMDVHFCLSALEAALGQGKPQIFNSDQGAQFTSAAFTRSWKSKMSRFPKMEKDEPLTIFLLNVCGAV
jgi:putative transposase